MGFPKGVESGLSEHFIYNIIKTLIKKTNLKKCKV